jgi:hypothetical protein
MIFPSNIQEFNASNSRYYELPRNEYVNIPSTTVAGQDYVSTWLTAPNVLGSRDKLVSKSRNAALLTYSRGLRGCLVLLKPVSMKYGDGHSNSKLTS